MHQFHRRGTGALGAEVLESVFEMWWPRLEVRIKEIMESAPLGPERIRSDRDIMDEFLARIRSMSARTHLRTYTHPYAMRDLLRTYEMLCKEVDLMPPEIRSILERPIANLKPPIELLRSGVRHRGPPPRLGNPAPEQPSD